MARRAYLAATAFAFMLVLLPFLFWYDTWFGRRLSDSQIQGYLNDAVKPRRAQHAMVQIGERLSRGDVSVRRWHPRVIELSASDAAELRQTAAWIMGQDTGYEPFHARLRELLGDGSVLVRRNAALSLAAWRDPDARGELLAMLRPFTALAPAGGRLKYGPQAGEYVNQGTLLARIGDAALRSPVPGEVRVLLRPEGAWVLAGEPLLEISPDKSHVWEALRGLCVVGDAHDAAAVEPWARGVSGMPERLRQQAALTLAEIQRRGSQPPFRP